MKRFKSFNTVILCALIALLSGCAHQPQHFTVKRGEVFTPGVKITAEDGSFTLKYGEPFKTPFHNGPYTTDSSELVYDLQNAVNDGAKLVRVTVPGLNEPLYGALMIPAIQEGAKGPATRSLGIDVPQKYVNAALGAKVSVVYEVVTLEEAGEDYPEEIGYAWILWLSDSPFVLDNRPVLKRKPYEY